MKVHERGIPWPSKGLELRASIAKGQGLAWGSQKKKRGKCLGKEGFKCCLVMAMTENAQQKKKKKMNML